MREQDVSRRLDDAEVQELSAFLASAPGALTYTEAHGFITAMLSAPNAIAPSVWQAQLRGEGGFADMAHAQRIVGLVLRLNNQIVGDLEARRDITPADGSDDEVRAWCTGYLRASRLDPAWRKDEGGAVFLMPMAILSGELDLRGQEDHEGRTITDPSAQLRRCRAGLNSMVHEAHQYWMVRRRAGVPLAPTKLGRNEPCSCGSGQKYKKCCG